MQPFADQLDADDGSAAQRGLVARVSSPDHAFAVVGAVTELVSRQVRFAEPTTSGSWRP